MPHRNISVLTLFMIMPQLIINTYVSLMYELKKNGKVFTSKSDGTGPSSYEKRIYRAAVSQRLRNTAVDDFRSQSCLLWQSIRLKGRSLNVLEYIHHLPFFHVTSSIMPFSLSSSIDNVAVAVNEGH